MADTTLQNGSHSEQHAKLDRLAGEIQIMAARLGALAHAADNSIDNQEEDEEKRSTLSRASLLIQTMEETAARIDKLGEEVECVCRELRLG